MDGGRDARVTPIVSPVDDRARLRADDRHGEAQVGHGGLVGQQVGEEATGIFRQGGVGVFVRGAPLVDEFKGVVIPGEGGSFGGDLLPQEGVILLLGQRLAEDVDRIVRVIQRMVEGVVVNGDPGAFLKEVGAALAHHQGQRVVLLAGAHGGEGRKPSHGDDAIGVVDEVIYHDLQPILRHVAALPLGGEVGLVVGLKVADAYGDQAPEGLLLPPADVAGVGGFAI